MVQKANTIEELLQDCPVNSIIGDNLIRAWSKINSHKYKKIVCSISGGSDSDVMLDIVWRCDKDNKVDYVWFDTGLEYQATKEHLKYLANKYNIKIKPYKAIKPIPISCKQYGQPFINKQAAEYIDRLQRHSFKWEDKSFDELYKEYPKCKAALLWWCNLKKSNAFNIANNKWLKEFIIENPPTFKISSNLSALTLLIIAIFSKKILDKLIKENTYELNIVGVRRAEGGVRATSYKSCFSEGDDGCDNYRPLFWYKDSDKIDYENAYNVEHSDCYVVYALPRTGCAGCPFGRDFENELEIIQKYEPKLYKAVNNIFGDSYEYTRKYREFVKKMNKSRE